jgi:hypothetical protein
MGYLGVAVPSILTICGSELVISGVRDLTYALQMRLC